MRQPELTAEQRRDHCLILASDSSCLLDLVEFSNFSGQFFHSFKELRRIYIAINKPKPFGGRKRSPAILLLFVNSRGEHRRRPLLLSDSAPIPDRTWSYNPDTPLCDLRLQGKHDGLLGGRYLLRHFEGFGPNGKGYLLACRALIFPGPSSELPLPWPSHPARTILLQRNSSYR